MSDEVVTAIAEAQRRQDGRIWEQGFKAGRISGLTGDTSIKNPYGDPPGRLGPPPFPEFTFRMDENMTQATERWTQQMREFASAWDMWSATLR